MSVIPHRRASGQVRTLLLAAAAFAASGAVPAVLASEAGPAEARAIDPGAVLFQVSDLMQAGRVVKAKTLLGELTSAGAVGLSDDERALAAKLAKECEVELRSLNTFAVAIQSAELGLETDDLAMAEQKARVVSSSSEASGSQRVEATKLLERISARRVALADQMDDVADTALVAFEAGEFEVSSRALARVSRSGVRLDRDRASKLAELSSKLTEVELTRGEAFPASLTLLGPVKSDWLLGSTDEVNASVMEQPATDPPEMDAIEQARTFEAKSLLGEAEQALAERRLNDSVEKFTRVLTNLRPYLTEAEIARAEEGRREAQVQLGRDGGPQGDVLTDEIRDRGLQRQQVLAEFNNKMQQADAAVASGNITRARNLSAQAELAARQGRAVLSEAQYEDLLAQVSAKRTSVNAAEEEIRIRENEAQAERIATDARTAERDRLADRDRRINEAISRVRDLQAEMKYDEALEVVDQILFLDPINPVGLLLRDVIRDALIYVEYDRAVSEGRRVMAQQFMENQRATVPDTDLINYPDDWPAISTTRLDALAFNESAVDRSALAQLESTRVQVNFEDNPLSDVLGFIQSQAQVDMDVDWTSLEDIGIDRDSPVSLRLSSGVATSTVLDRVLAKVSDPALPADWAIQDGIVVVASDDVLRRNTTMLSYDIRDLLFEVPNFTNAPEFDLQTSGGQGGGGQSPFGGGGGQDEDRLPREERVQNVIDAIQNNVDPNGWLAVGGSTGAVQELQGVLIITQTPKAHREINGLLNMLRGQRAVQINVEARFLLVAQDFFEQIGFDLDVYFGDNNATELAQAIDPSATFADFFNEDGSLADNVVGDGLFFTDTDGDGVADAFANIQQPVFAPNLLGDEWSPVSGSQNSFGLTEGLAAGASGFASTILAQNPALSVTGRFLDDIQVDFLVEATQADQRSVTLTAPRLTFTNGQRAWVAVTRDQAYISDLQPIVSDGSAAFDPTVSVAQDGVVLDIEGVASADRRYVTLTVITGISEIAFDQSVTVEATAGGAATTSAGTQIGGTATGIIQIPVADQTIIRTTVTIPDQGTLMLGGQRIVSEVEVETGVPVLSKIPVLSRFFSNRIDSKEEQTLLILIRPQILIQDEQEEQNFPGLLDQLGR